MGISVSGATAEGRDLTVRVRAKRNLTHLRFAIVGGKKQVALERRRRPEAGHAHADQTARHHAEGLALSPARDGRRGKARARGFIKGLRVLPGNKPPTDITLSNAAVAENLPAATTVGALAAVDANNTPTGTLSRWSPGRAAVTTPPS